MKLFFHIGRYTELMFKVIARPEKFKLFVKQTLNEVDSIGIQSLGIIIIISFFMGAVVVIQTAYNIDTPLIPKYLIGFTARQSVILEFSSSILCLILAGKVGSRIASEIGTMRVTEQIDALDIMGINSASYLILPKVLGGMFIMPFLSVISMFIALIGGYVAGVLGGLVSHPHYLEGLQLDFNIFDVSYALIKVVFFAFALTSIPAYHGYYSYGGAVDVGKSSTVAVVYSSIVILFMNYILTQIML